MTAAPDTTIPAITTLDIVSDPICPWCYIGKTRLQQALERRAPQRFQISWHPFQLNPDMPPEGMDRRDYLEHKFGGKAGALEVYGQIAKAAQEAGLQINFEAIQRTPDTTDAHRLIHWAGQEGGLEDVQTQVADRLFSAYFQDGQDISDPDVLVAVATASGMEGAVVRRLLASDNDRSQIKAQAAYARQKGIRGVPCFVVANTYVLQGAQPVELWEKVIDEITEKGRLATRSPQPEKGKV